MTAGASPSRCAVACAYDATHAYGSGPAAQAAAQGGDRVVYKCGTYPAQSFDTNAKASVVSYYGENYDQADTAVSVYSAGTCVYAFSLTVNIDKVHVWGLQGVKSPWTARTDSILTYQDVMDDTGSASLSICGSGSGCPSATTDILVDG